LTLIDSKVTAIIDYQSSIHKDLLTDKETNIDLPKSNVLQFLTADGTKISIRPSGTEPKIKFYFSVKEELPSLEEFEAIDKNLTEKINKISKELKIKE
jgi:phosphoglucomutase